MDGRAGCVPIETGGRQDLTRALSLTDPCPDADILHNHVSLSKRKQQHRNKRLILTERSGPDLEFSGFPTKTLRGPGLGPGCPATLNLLCPQPTPTLSPCSRWPGLKSSLLSRGTDEAHLLEGAVSKRLWTYVEITTVTNKHPGREALRLCKHLTSPHLAF